MHKIYIKRINAEKNVEVSTESEDHTGEVPQSKIFL